MIKKLCVFPNDPIISSYNKGEIKERYYNPLNTFDEIHVISFIEKDMEESKVQTIVGNAKLKIHSVGKINLKNRSKNKESVKNLIKEINPDVIRAYNPLVEGWFAAICAKELGIPLYVSLHTQYDHLRQINKRSNFKKYLALKYSEKFIEPFVLKNANKITIVYKIIEPYVVRMCGKKPEILYNKIDCKRFSEGKPIEGLSKPLVISVGSLIKPKNHACLINAMKHLNAHLLIIGNGVEYDSLINLIKKLNLTEKVIIRKSVPNNQIQDYYKSAKIFALAYDPKLEGLPIPVMEAMASGLPVVIPPPKVGYSEGLEEVAMFADRDPVSFAKAFNHLLEDSKSAMTFSARSLQKAMEFDSTVIEKREADIYRELLSKDS